MHCINAVWPDNNYVFSYLRMLTTWHCPHSLASRCMLQQSIDVSCRRAHSNKPAARCCSGRVGQSDGQTPYRFIDPASHTMRAVPIKSCITYELESVVIYKFSGQSRRNVAFLCLYHFVSVFQLARCLHNYHPASCIDDVATRTSRPLATTLKSYATPLKNSWPTEESSPTLKQYISKMWTAARL